MKTHLTLSWLAALAIAGLGTLHAADTKSMLNSSDEKFVKMAAMSGQNEVKVSTLAVGKAESAEVKTIAEMMVKDHTAVNEELAGFAKTKGVEISAAGDSNTPDVIAKLEKESGKDFDKAYLKQLKDDHQKSVDKFEDASKNANDGDLKAWAGKTLPKLQAHLDHVNKALENLK